MIPVAKKLVGPMKKIRRSHEELSEGPHMFKKDGWYYVFLAHGGTGNNHGELTARCRTVDGVYEPDPRGMFITSRFDPDWPLQRAGHTSLVETPQGRWFVSCLCGRPIRNSGRCVLGRETALAEVVWTEDGWPRLKNGGLTPELTLDTGLEPHPRSPGTGHRGTAYPAGVLPEPAPALDRREGIFRHRPPRLAAPLRRGKPLLPV